MPGTDRERIVRLEAQVAGLDRLVEALGPVAGDQIRTMADVAVMNRELDEFKAWLGDVEARLRREQEEADRRQNANAERIEKACTAWAKKLDAALPQLEAVKREQDQQTAALTRREKWLLLLAGAFASGAVALIVNLLTQHSG